MKKPIIRKLEKWQKEKLLEWGYQEDDIAQIEKALTKTTFTMHFNKLDGLKDKKITQWEARWHLTPEDFLSGLSRSAFHYSSSRTSKEGDFTIHFDSSKLFR